MGISRGKPVNFVDSWGAIPEGGKNKEERIMVSVLLICFALACVGAAVYLATQTA